MKLQMNSAVPYLPSIHSGGNPATSVGRLSACVAGKTLLVRTMNLIEREDPDADDSPFDLVTDRLLV